MFSKFAEMFAKINGFVEKTMVEVEMQKTSDSHVDERQPRLLDSSKSKEPLKCLADCIICHPPQNEARARHLAQANVWQAATSLYCGISEVERVHNYDEDLKEKSGQAVMGCLPVLQRMKPTFAKHKDSESCIFCRFASGDTPYRPPNPMKFGQSEKRIAIANHPVDFSLYEEWSATTNHSSFPLNVPDMMEVRTLRVDLILERHDQWNAVLMQEYERDLKSHLKRAVRQNPKDLNTFVPLSPGSFGHAREVANEINSQLFRLWLDRCRDYHRTICGQQGSVVALKGLILIDTVKDCLYDVVEGQTPQYTVLSYVWGYVDQPTLGLDIFESWHQAGALSDVSIPRKIRDAMYVTRSIGFRYLWVDALCIVQDESMLRHQQIHQMYLIYQQAELTIVAADSDDCSTGLSGISQSQERTRARGTYNINGLQLAKVPNEPNYALQASPWRTRGWTPQEELCSRRALIFLPNIVLFSCPSAVWREDICLENKELPRTNVGLKSLLPMLSSNSMKSKEVIGLFRDLVRQYLQRTFTRIDDMENAFAGVAAILEQLLLGPIYHGIPEAYFGEIVEGCWFWDLKLRQRFGFPSWSWTGWIYEKENADSGIEPLASLGDTSNFLKFFKLETYIQSLGHSIGDDHELLSCRDIRSDLVSHFIPDQDAMRLAQRQLVGKQNNPTYLIAFYTSIAYMELRAPPGLAFDRTREYRVVHPGTKQELTRLHAAVSFVSEHGTLSPFIVIAHCPEAKAFRLMLVRIVDDIFFKVNVTAPRRPVKEDDWCSLKPTKRLVVMA